MHDWKRTLREGLVSGTLGGLFSMAVLLVAGKRETGSAVAAVNAESQWLWGEESLRENAPTLRHTLTGLVTHQLATVFWATLYVLVRGERRTVRTTRQALVGGAATSATAALVDYTLVPRRLTPGFEHRLSAASLIGVFGAIAAGIAVGGLLLREHD